MLCVANRNKEVQEIYTRKEDGRWTSKAKYVVINCNKLGYADAVFK